MLEPQLEDNLDLLDKEYNNINNEYTDSLHLLEGGSKPPKAAKAPKTPKPTEVAKAKPTEVAKAKSTEAAKPTEDQLKQTTVPKQEGEKAVDIKAVDIKGVSSTLKTNKGSRSTKEKKGRKAELYASAKNEITIKLDERAKEVISKIDTKLSPNEYRKQLRETIENSVVKNYDTDQKINEAIPKDVKQLIPDYEKLDLNQKRKLLTYYLRDMSDNKNFSKSSDSYNKRIKETVKGFNNYIIPQKYNDAILKQYPTSKSDIAPAANKLVGKVAELASKSPEKVVAGINGRLATSAEKEKTKAEINKYNTEIDNHNEKIADYEEKKALNIEALEEKQSEIQSLELKKKETIDSIEKNDKKKSNLENQLKNISGADIKAKRTELKSILPKDKLEKDYKAILLEIKEQPKTVKLQTNNTLADNIKYNTKSNLNAKLSTIREQLKKRRTLEKEIKLIDGYNTEIAKITKKQNELNKTKKEQTAIIERSNRQMDTVKNLIAKETQKIEGVKEQITTLKSENPDKEFKATAFMDSLKSMNDNTKLNSKMTEIKSGLAKKTAEKTKLLEELKTVEDPGIKSEIEKKIEILEKGISVENRRANILKTHSKNIIFTEMEAGLKAQRISDDMIKHIKDVVKNKEGLDHTNIENLKSSIKTNIDKYIESPQYIIKKNALEVNKLKESLKTEQDSTKKQEIENLIKKLKAESNKSKLQSATESTSKIADEIQNKETAISALKTKLETISNEDSKQTIEDNITKLESDIAIDKGKMNNVIQNSKKLILDGMNDDLKAQGFTPQQILMAKGLVKDNELKGDNFTEKMDNAKKQLIAKISLPEFKIDINKSKIVELQKQLLDDQGKGMNKIEESKLKRQIQNLTNNNIKLAKQSIIMNNTTDKYKTRKRSARIIGTINKELQRTNTTLQFLKTGYEEAKAKATKEPGDEALISRYEKLQSDKYGMEQRKVVLQNKIESKTFEKSIISQTTSKPKKMSNKEFTDFKTQLTSKILVNNTTKTPNNTTKKPNKQKIINYQLRINSFTDALKRGDSGVAKAQARFLKSHYGIDVKNYTLNNINKLGSIVKDNAKKYINNGARELLNKRANQIRNSILTKGQTQAEINAYLATRKGKKEEATLIELRSQAKQKTSTTPEQNTPAPEQKTSTTPEQKTSTTPEQPITSTTPEQPITPTLVLGNAKLFPKPDESQVGGTYKKGRKRSKKGLCISTSKKKTKRCNY